MPPADDASTAKNRRVLNVLELVLELEPALRGAYLETLGRGDQELKQQVLAHLRLLGGQSEAEAGEAANFPAASLEMPARVGPYQVVREIGRGGMSRVYLAERADELFEHKVALKVIDQGLEAPIAHQRFLAERQILASFDCPQIAKLFDGGTLPNGRPYLVMELVDGVRADHFCAESKLTLPERLLLFRKICGAVSYAHQKLVVHRDLKPSNILVTAEHEPKLLDFGIAKLLDPDSFPFPLSEATRSHHRLMTPTYASPEQLLGEPISTATDVYALGVLLFQLLTGDVPHPDQDRLQLVLRERAGEIKSPKPSESLGTPAAEHTWEEQDLRRLSRQLRGDLDNIVAKALRPRAEVRYASVVELDEDLHRYLEGEPVRATRETPYYLLSKFLRRYRLPVVLAATVLVLISAFAVFTQQQALHIAKERDRANEIRGFLATLISSADMQSRRSGTVSLNELLDENLERLKTQPFQDPQTQFELLELVGDGFASLEIFQKASEAYSSALALVKPEEEDAKQVQLRLKLSFSLWSLGLPDQALAILKSVDLTTYGQGPTACQLQIMVGEFDAAASNLQRILQDIASKAPTIGNDQLLIPLRLRLALASDVNSFWTQQAADDIYVVLSQSESTSYDHWEILSRYFRQFNDPGSAIQSSLFLFRTAHEGHGYGILMNHLLENLTEPLYAMSRFDEALATNLASQRALGELFKLDPSSPRTLYQVAKLKTQEGEILQALDRPAEAAAALDEAIGILQKLARESSITYTLGTLVRAYIADGRLDEAKELVKILLERGWRRPDLMRLAAEKGALPDPMPPALELDLSLPPRLRAYIDSLPHKTPPWQTATDLPTIEEILAAEAARLATDTKSR